MLDDELINLCRLIHTSRFIPAFDNAITKIYMTIRYLSRYLKNPFFKTIILQIIEENHHKDNFLKIADSFVKIYGNYKYRNNSE